MEKLKDKLMKSVDHFTYFCINISSTESDVSLRIEKTWAVINRLLTMWKSNLSDKIKRKFFQDVLYSCTTSTLAKRFEKKMLDANYTRMLHATLNKSWKQYSTKQQMYNHWPPISQTIQVSRTRYAGYYWRNVGELISKVLPWASTQGLTGFSWPTKSYIHQLCGYTRYRLEDQSRWAILTDKGKLRETESKDFEPSSRLDEENYH